VRTPTPAHLRPHTLKTVKSQPATNPPPPTPAPPTPAPTPPEPPTTKPDEPKLPF
jgi:hypothetical protein